MFYSEQYKVQSQNNYGDKRKWLNLSCLMPQNSIDLNNSTHPQYTGL